MIEELAREVWTLLSEQSEAKYVHRNDPDPYKPFYRISTILASPAWGPPHFKKGVARHLTDEEVVAVVRLAHPYLAERLSDEGGEAKLLRIFHSVAELWGAELYDPEWWAP